MAGYRKLSRTADQRKALIRSQVTALIQHGKIVTTEAKAKEIRKVAEGLIAMAVKEVVNGKQTTVYDEVQKEIKQDAPSKLHARRQMAKVLYPVKEVPAEGKKAKEIDLTDKLFNEIAPKYANRNGGYTRIVKIGLRKGDAAMEVVLELV